jgi:hypothetical protein
LASLAEKPEEKAELYKKSADEFKEGKLDEQYHQSLGHYYSFQASIAESPEKKVELYKKSADEFKEGKRDEQYHQAMGWHYYWLAIATKNSEEKAELYKKSADVFKEGKLDKQYHQSMGWYYNSLANVAENPEEQTELYKKSADEFKEGKFDEQYHQVMAWHYCSKGEKWKAAKETNWLYVASIALNKVGISNQAEKIKKFPNYSVFIIDGNIKDEKRIDKIAKEVSKNFNPPDIIPYTREILPSNLDDLNDWIEESDFIFLLIEDDIDKILAFELGLAYNASKHVVILAQTNKIDPVFQEVVTITNNEEYAIAALNVRSILESQKFIEIEKEDRKDFDNFISLFKKVAAALGIRLSTKEEKKGYW